MNKDFGEWTPRKGALPEVMHTIKPATFVLDAGEYADQLPPLHVVEMRCDMVDRSHYEKMKKDFVVQFGKEKLRRLAQLLLHRSYNRCRQDLFTVPKQQRPIRLGV